LRWEREEERTVGRRRRGRRKGRNIVGGCVVRGGWWVVGGCVVGGGWWVGAWWVVRGACFK
jgi:hypothetical protein